jgi:hypothetical protein
MPSKKIKREEDFVEHEIAALPEELLLNSTLLFEQENEVEDTPTNLDEVRRQEEKGEDEKNIEPQDQVLKLEDEDTETYYQKVKKEISQYLNRRQEYVDNLRRKAQERLMAMMKVAAKERTRISPKNRIVFREESAIESSRTKRDKDIEKDGIKPNNRKNITAAETAKSRKDLFDDLRIDSKKRLNTDSTYLKRHDIAKSTLSADKSKKNLVYGLKIDSKKSLDMDITCSKRHNPAKTELVTEMECKGRERLKKERRTFHRYAGKDSVSTKTTNENRKGSHLRKRFTMSMYNYQEMRIMDIKYERKKDNDRFSMKIWNG